jgi:DNA-binding NarL/FixJ family response regulator
MLSGSMRPQVVDEAAAAGAVGYLLKGGDGNALISGIRSVAAGGTAWPQHADALPA